MFGIKVSNNFWTVVTVAFTLGSLVYLFDAKPDIAPLFMAAAIPFVVGVIGQMQQSVKHTEEIAKLDSKVVGVADKVETVAAVSTEAKVAAVESVAASKKNALTLAVTSIQQAHAQEEQAQTLKQVDRKVDGHLGSILAEMKQMAKQIARLEQDKALLINDQVHQETGTAKILSALADMAPAPSTGSTPPHGTPIEGTTTITVDPADAAAITHTPPKGKRPGPGEHQ